MLPVDSSQGEMPVRPHVGLTRSLDLATRRAPAGESGGRGELYGLGADRLGLAPAQSPEPEAQERELLHPLGYID